MKRKCLLCGNEDGNKISIDQNLGTEQCDICGSLLFEITDCSTMDVPTDEFLDNIL